MPDNSAAGAAALLAAAIAVLALAMTLLLAVRLGRLQRAYDALVGDAADASFTGAITQQANAAEQVRTEVAALRADLGSTRSDLATALRHVGVVRYDAFGDMGGRLSFSAALLDDAGDGVVLTSINGRSETRTYAKGVSQRSSDQSLSPEEEQAIAHATRSDRPAGSPSRSASRA